jgi:hypothetical protein
VNSSQIQEEEQQILPKFADKATPQQLEELGEKFAVAKEQAFAR